MATGRLELCNRIRMEAEDIERTGFPLEVLPQAVQSSPGQKMKACAMPDAADQKGNHKIHSTAKLSLSAAAKGNIQIIPEPRA